jgi:hypothetical protein
MSFKAVLLSLLFLHALTGNAHCTCDMFFTVGLCDTFESWSDLSNISQYTVSAQTSFINIHPNEPVAVTNDFNMTQVIMIFYNITTESKGQPQTINLNLMSIDGIDVMPWTDPGLMSASLTLEITFVQSHIDFFINETEISDEECYAAMISKYEDKITTFFQISSDIIFKHQNTYPKNPICPFVFSKAALTSLSIFSLIDSIMICNLWKFKSFDKNSNQTTINSTIYELNLAGYGFDLNTSLMHPLVFKSAIFLYIYQSVDSIQADIFAHFSQVKYITLELDSLMNFVHKIGRLDYESTSDKSIVDRIINI